MIKPHGADALMPLFVVDPAERDALGAAAQDFQQVLVSSATAANAVMLGGGYFTPLQGYMTKADALSVADSMRTTDGVFFPVPVLNLLPEINAQVGDQIALLDPNVEGNPVIAVQTISAIDELTEQELMQVAQAVYGTTDAAHPGVAAFLAQGRYVVAGEIQVLNFSYFETEFAETFRTAVQIRAEIEERGWNKVVAFQTRNPMHRAHEELCKMAMEATDADGCVIHMLLGKLKEGDIPADVRDASIREMVKNYFPENSVMVTGYGFDMLYAGPREAVLHALFRQNMGATHFIIGRDHAGVGDYYGAFDAQTIFDTDVPEGALEIEIFRADHTAYSKKLNKVVMMRDVPDHAFEDFVILSGTKVRELLGNGIAPPPEFSRPEVAKILMDYYQKLDA
ncbi:sulfate adenylyltransferase [Arenicella chitinivorans]|uniref:Sulfate adenylyltransferase n=1 Tax=Arenicella chitinivorans TaxID=1329800 RepID=A0A918RR12_9GAMM|nr:sulfate adenylyltransferase [Arenicella chitinivorans]GHA06941.1 sulfate adenylyltransferase [Arenicella chitinivorans]